MRKNSPRKWVHAILDLLPLVIIPIFALAVRSDNNFQPIEVQAQNYEVVNFNQLSNDFTSHNIDNNTAYNFNELTTLVKGKYLIGFDYDGTPSSNNLIFGGYNSNYEFQGVAYSLISNSTLINDVNYKIIEVSQNYDFIFGYSIYNQTGVNLDISTLSLFNLTLMFGEGNEPTIQQFKNYYPNKIYPYTLNKRELLNVGTKTYSDTDVGSQMVYTLYNATDKYFNMNSVFNLGSVWDWVQLNIFNGNAPLVAYVVWQVIIYEFIVDILFIFYSFFMFLIDFCEYLLEKPFNKINRGK